MLVQVADSDHIGPIIINLTELGYPEDVEALDELTEAERRRTSPPRSSARRTS